MKEENQVTQDAKPLEAPKMRVFEFRFISLKKAARMRKKLRIRQSKAWKNHKHMLIFPEVDAIQEIVNDISNTLPHITVVFGGNRPFSKDMTIKEFKDAGFVSFCLFHKRYKSVAIALMNKHQMAIPCIARYSPVTVVCGGE